ncbi:hypothetical protein PO768_25370 [Paucibacter sp. XJ19-41]|nr:hypothetical protein [Paucibacter sp. XJ19-41]
MGTVNLLNTGGVPFLMLRGICVVRTGQQPDGDTLAFAAAKAYKSNRVKTNVPVDPSGKRTVNIRLQSIDAPEKAQPLGAKARDALLKKVGISPKAMGLTDQDFTADGPLTAVPAWLATHGLDGNQRPLGYIFPSLSGFAHGQEVSAAAVTPLVKSSVNHSQAARGHAFPAYYDNTEEAHALVFQAAAAAARNRSLGVWAVDATTRGFVPTKSALTAAGALVYPKFFRRVQEWNDPAPTVAKFIRWLKAQSDGQKLVLGAERDPLPLWKLFKTVDAKRVSVPYDVNKLWFSE